MGAPSRSFAQLLAAELRELEQRLAAAHAASVSAAAPAPAYSPAPSRGALPAEGAAAAGETEPAAGPGPCEGEPPLPQEDEPPWARGSRGGSGAEPAVPPSRSTPLAQWQGERGRPGPEAPSCRPLVVSPPSSPTGRRTRAGSAGSVSGTPSERATARWWKLAAQVLNIGCQHALRDCWAEELSCHSPKGGRVSLISAGQEADAQRAFARWTLGTRLRKSSSMSDSERQQPHGLRRCVLHPYSWKRLVWILAGFAFTGFEIFCLTMDQFTSLDGSAVNQVEVVAGLYWTFDVILSFFTGVFINSQLELQIWTISKHYLKSWFIFDATLVLLQWATQPMDSNEEESSGRSGVAKYIRIARYLRLFRFVKFDHVLQSILVRINSIPAILLVRVSQYLAGILLWIHTTACAWYALGVSGETGWARQRESIQTWPANYWISMHWAISNMQGNVDVGPGDLASERAFTVCHILVSVLLLASFLSKLTMVMATLGEISATLNRQSTAAQQYCKRHAISTQLSIRVRKWLEVHQILDAKHQRGVEEEEFMQILPTDLRRALLHESRSPLLLKHGIFHACRDCNDNFFQRLTCDAFTPMTLMPEEDVFSYGMVCMHMYFVASGECTYLKYGDAMRALMQSVMVMRKPPRSEVKDRYKRSHSTHLPEGASLCEAVLWVQWVHVGDFSAVTKLSLLVLEMGGFEALVVSYPNILGALQAHALHFLEAISGAEDPCDLFNSVRALRLLKA